MANSLDSGVDSSGVDSRSGVDSSNNGTSDMTTTSQQALPPSPPFSGTLYKKRDHFATYRPRLFVLDDTLLHYYYSSSDPSPAKSIYLTGCTIKDCGQILVEGRNMRGIQVSHRATAKAYNLAAEDNQVRNGEKERRREGEKERRTI